jgi:hypothetical protein
MRSFLLCGTLLTLSSQHAWASDLRLIQCSKSGPLARKCLVLTQQLASVIAYGDERYETDYHVSFHFTCRGDRPGFGLTADRDKTEIKTPVARDGLQSIVVTGAEDLWAFDPAPRVTEGQNFRSPCEWKIASVRRNPSDVTARGWRTEEGIQKTLTERTAYLTGVLQSFDNYRNWDQSTTQTILQSVMDKEAYFRGLCAQNSTDVACDASFDLELVRRTLESKVAYDPSLPAYRNVASLYEAMLTQEELKLQGMQKRRVDWGVPE